jgi:hypothetical protein
MLLGAVRDTGISVAGERVFCPVRDASGWTAVLSLSGRIVRAQRLVVATGHHGRRWLPSARHGPERQLAGAVCAL